MRSGLPLAVGEYDDGGFRPRTRIESCINLVSDSKFVDSDGGDSEESSSM